MLEILLGGTGGLLIVYAKSITNTGKIYSKGSNGVTPGGSSGGGSINVFYLNQWINEGEINVNGGNLGGVGGNGSISVGNISSGTYENTFNNYNK